MPIDIVLPRLNSYVILKVKFSFDSVFLYNSIKINFILIKTRLKKYTNSSSGEHKRFKYLLNE